MTDSGGHVGEIQDDRWEGFTERECGDHRTTGGRAWCFDCSEWCYKHVPCKGCEVPRLRDVLDRVVKYLGSMPDAGLTDDDPRLAWYVASVPLRAEAMDLLGQAHAWHDFGSTPGGSDG